MRRRTLGDTGIAVSEIGFGTGGISRLMVGDDGEAQLRAVRGALDGGVNFFDTAMGYGSGKSEANLGAALNRLGADVVLTTKIRLTAGEREAPEEAVVASVEKSLERLGRPRVDLIQIHNYVAPERNWPVGEVAFDLDDIYRAGGVLDGFKVLRDRGLVRFFGFTGIGYPALLNEMVDSGEFHTVQVYFNLLNPSAAYPVPESFSAVDYGLLIERAAEVGMGVLAIRALALGALTAEPNLLGFLDERPPVLSLGSEYDKDVERAEKLAFLVREGCTLAQAALRFVLSHDEVSCALVGFSGEEQLAEALTGADAGPLPEESIRRLWDIWDSDFA